MSDLLLKDMKENGVLTLTLNREEVHNAFNSELINVLSEAFKDADANSEVRLIVLTGSGRSFCAGADLNWMKSMKDYSMDENIQDSKKLAKMFQIINTCSKPVLAKVNGHALGGGVGLLSVCDFVHTHEKAKFGFTEVKLGLIPAVISPFVINKIGESFARAYFLSGAMFNSHKAFHMGLVHESSKLETFDEDFEKNVSDFLLAAPIASVKSKKLISKVKEQSFSDMEKYTCQAISECRVSKEGQEGMSALLEKRSPGWIK